MTDKEKSEMMFGAWVDFEERLNNLMTYVRNPAHKIDDAIVPFIDMLDAAKSFCKYRKNFYAKKCEAIKTLEEN